MKKLYSSILVLLITLTSFQNAKAAGPFYYTGNGAAVTLLSSWNSNPAGGGTTPTSFNTASTTWNLYFIGNLTLTSAWAFASTSILNIGDGSGAVKITVSSLGNITGPPKINVANAATVTIAGSSLNLNTSKTFFLTGSTAVYASGSTFNFSLTYYNLAINVATNLNGNSINATGDFTAGAAIDLGAGSLNVGGKTTLNAILTPGGGILTLGGQLAGTSGIVGDQGIITLTGTGNIGTLNITSPFQLTELDVNLGSASSTVTLGNSITLDGGNLTLGGGVLNLNGKQLTLANTSAATGAVFSGGFIAGSSASALYITAASVSGSMLMATSANTLNALLLNASGQTLSLGNSLNIIDSISVYDGNITTGGNLTLISDATKHARVGLIGTTGSISGNATVQVYASRPVTGWAQLGTPGVNGQIIGNWDGQFPITCTGCNYDPSSLSPHFFSVQGWDETGAAAPDGYDTTVTYNTALTPGIGFWAYLGATSAGNSAITYQHTGSLVQGQVSVNITETGVISTGDDGWNLIANPYASPISYDVFYNFNGQGGNLDGNAQLWDANFGERDIAFGNGDIIPAGQGIYVKAFGNSVTYTMVFDESMKTADNTSANNLLRTTATNQSTIPRFNLVITDQYGPEDRTAFRFKTDASTDFDRRYDGHKRFTTPGYMGTGPVFSNYTTISSKLQNIDYSTNTLPVLTNSMSIPVLAKVSATGTYSISMEDIINYPGCAILHDKLTDAYHDLSTGAYAITISDTTTAPRFELILCEMTAPVSVKQLISSLSDIQVIQDEQGAYVTTHFEQPTKGTISVYNVIGQQLIKDLKVEGTDTKTLLNLNSHNEMLLINVTTDKGTVTKKIITR